MVRRIFLYLNSISAIVCMSIAILLSLELVFITSDQNRVLFSTLHLWIMGYVLADMGIRFLFARKVPTHLVARACDALVLIPLISMLFNAVPLIDMYSLVQIILGVVFVGRIGHLRDIGRVLRVQPAQLFVLAFVLFIFIGALLLSLPIARVGAAPLRFIDALFTATSAICVTGLVVNDIGTYFSGFGQFIIIALIQLGGLGIMSFYALAIIFLSSKVSRSQSIEYQENLATEGVRETFALVKSIFVYTFVVELIGAGLLLVFWGHHFETLQEGILLSLFHSISAFCNAGFSLFSDSLMGFSTNVGVILTMSILIIIGGVGFPVIFNLRQRLFKRDKEIRLKVQTKLTLFVSVILIGIGMIMIMLGEYGAALGDLSFGNKLLMSFFHSVSARSAGFNAVDLGAFSYGTILVITLLMFIGASPGSTGGGIKTTTFGVIHAALFRVIQGETKVEIFGRTISSTNVFRGLIIFFISAIVVFTGLYFLLLTEVFSFVPLLFEAVSAFGTAGLSLGVTGGLSSLGKISIIVLMFIGRLGPLSLGVALARRKQRANYAFPEERILLG